MVPGLQCARLAVALDYEDPDGEQAWVAVRAPARLRAHRRRLGEPERALLALYQHFYDQEAMDDIRRMIEAEPAEIGRR